jgi:hypothetical protein
MDDNADQGHAPAGDEEYPAHGIGIEHEEAKCTGGHNKSNETDLETQELSLVDSEKRRGSEALQNSRLAIGTLTRFPFTATRRIIETD